MYTLRENGQKFAIVNNRGETLLHGFQYEDILNTEMKKIKTLYTWFLPYMFC